MTLYSASLNVHLLAGAIALLSFWTAALARKGSRPHVLAGRVYLLAMLGIVVSGIPLVARFVLDGKPVMASFLGYLLLLVSWTCWCAWRAVRDRRRPERYAGPVYLALSALVLVAGLAIIALGSARGAVILVVFGLIGVLGGGGALRVRHRLGDNPRWWLKEHYGAMIGNGVATHVAFMSIGLRTLLPGVDGATLTYLAWFGPLAAALAAGWWLDRRYFRQPVISGQQGPCLEQAETGGIGPRSTPTVVADHRHG